MSLFVLNFLHNCCN